jgi:DNA helicase-2/ATP-dependent DNA helicase PcrA
MTLHSAKGLEFPHVYMVGLEEGLLPHRRVIAEGHGVEEERRLCYVGVTRAQDTLTLSLCKSRTKWGKARPSIPSRFLLEMRGDNEKAQLLAKAGQEAVEREMRAAAARADAKPEARKKKVARGAGGSARGKTPAASRPGLSAAQRPTIARS